jgi:hypothetical protein
VPDAGRPGLFLTALPAPLAIDFAARAEGAGFGSELARGQVTMDTAALDSAPAYLESAKAAGLGDVATAIGERVRAGDRRGAVALVPPFDLGALVQSFENAIALLGT